jgi:hypothetical protein
MSSRKRRLWDVAPVELDGGWQKKIDGIAYAEELLAYVGLWRREDRTEANWLDWISSAEQEWERRFPHPLSNAAIAFPDEVEHCDKPRLLGQTWLWTGEWRHVPSGDWTEFAEAMYGPGRYDIFTWGVLGYFDNRDARGEYLPRFDLHTVEDQTIKCQRDRFLLWELPRLLSCALKADQFLRFRYQTVLRPHLEVVRAKLLGLSKPSYGAETTDPYELTTKQSQTEIGTAARYLFELTDLLVALDVDTRSVDLALDEIKRCLPSADGRQHALLVGLDLLARQMRTSHEYGRATAVVAEQLLQRHSILGQIQQTTATDRLSKLGMALGSGLAAMQLSTDNRTRCVLFALMVGFCSWIYWSAICRGFGALFARRPD